MSAGGGAQTDMDATVTVRASRSAPPMVTSPVTPRLPTDCVADFSMSVTENIGEPL